MKVSVDINDSLNDVLMGLDQTRADVKRAIKRAQRKYTTFIQRLLIQAVVDASGVKRNLFKKHRVHVTTAYAEGQIKVWLGVAPVDLGYLGKVREVAGGVKAGKHYRPGAFMINDKNTAFKRVGKARLPILYQTEAIEPIAKPVVTQILQRGQQRLVTLLEQELNYALNHE
ncbi:hypothetical protein [Zooshikella harenae]|uniref:HK97 gp10 family phage protein n=1 Tax=Zooshikella harenae TaxID=2827238 RepID=A0ABS5ZJV5_9GAMM|nr:hypothetical protein [Zooshikella harenae]MBU2714364.1 hypothetical protein [Zooshikella harenae]